MRQLSRNSTTNPVGDMSFIVRYGVMTRLVFTFSLSGLKNDKITITVAVSILMDIFQIILQYSNVSGTTWSHEEGKLTRFNLPSMPVTSCMPAT